SIHIFAVIAFEMCIVRVLDVLYVLPPFSNIYRSLNYMHYNSTPYTTSGLIFTLVA
ncbi:hypothetical protein ACJX0J_013700, partial [Zea mays]